jgi:dTDP-4-amino-4,6-dideoxygalactose transaminase
MNQIVPFADLGAMTREVRSEVNQAWAELLDTSEFVRGDAVRRFESEWAAYCGTAFAIGVGNGTDALHLTLRALGIGQGDEVVIPANTFVATAEAVVLAGATPRFADVDPGTLLMTAQTLEAAITPQVRAVIAVHLFGQMPDMDSIGDLTARAGILLIEDAAQAHGATWRGRRAGSFGRAGGYSFYPGKNLGAFGDAGAIVTSDAALAERIDMMRDHGRATGQRHGHAILGTNSRLDTLQAAVLSAKLRRLDDWIEGRRRAAAAYRQALAQGPVRLAEVHFEAQHVYHLAVARVPDRDRVAAALRARGVATGVHYPKPCHLLEPYKQYADRPLPVAEQAAREILSLPMFPHMTESQVAFVCDALHEIVREAVVANV